MFKINLGKLDEFYSVTTRYKTHSAMFWIFPVTDETGDTKFLVIEDCFVPKDDTGNPRSFTAPRYRVHIYNYLDTAKEYCEFEVHLQYLINTGMSTYDAMSAALARHRKMAEANNE